VFSDQIPFVFLFPSPSKNVLLIYSIFKCMNYFKAYFIISQHWSFITRGNCCYAI